MVTRHVILSKYQIYNVSKKHKVYIQTDIQRETTLLLYDCKVYLIRIKENILEIDMQFSFPTVFYYRADRRERLYAI